MNSSPTPPASAATPTRRVTAELTEQVRRRVQALPSSARRSTPSSRRRCASRSSNRAGAPTAAPSTRSATSIILRRRRPAPHARHRPLPARRDAGPERRHPRRHRAWPQKLDTLSPDDHKRYMHHYNFPPYSVGEVRPMRGPGRREIGHGALAERALEPVLPTTEEFPYAIRVVCEILASNGSHLAWPASAAAPSPSWTPACRSRRPSPASPWASISGEDGDVQGPHRHRRPGRLHGRHGLQGRRYA